MKNRPTLAIVVSALLAAGSAGAGELQRELTRPIETDPTRAAASVAQREGEVLFMRWRLAGFLGFLAGLFVPKDGDALLTFAPAADERTEIQLLITTPRRAGEYYLYGAEIDAVTDATSLVFSSYVFNKKNKQRQQELERTDVLDFASAIYHLRWNPPDVRTRMAIWSDGKIYPCDVVPLPPGKRKISGKKLDVRGYLVLGVKLRGQPSFDDKFYVYFARDEHSTPVEIMGKRGLARVRFQLTDVKRPGGRNFRMAE